jgi:hypothetical protein
MTKSSKTSAAERVLEKEMDYRQYLRTQWKVPLSEEQYAIIRAGLGPIVRARAEAAQRAAVGDETE